MTDFEKIYSFENLYRAHKMARRCKQDRREVIRYELLLSENLQRLSFHLKNSTYRINNYHKFIIHDPKTREIQALSYGDRIVQHCLCDNVLGPYLDKRLIYDNSACRVGNGTHFALDRLTYFMRDFYKKYGSNGYILKCDIRKYFDSVDHEILVKKIDGMKLDDPGFHFYLTNTGKVIRTLRQQNKKKIKRKLKAFKRLYKKGGIDSQAIRSLISYNGHLKHGQTYKLRRAIWHDFVLRKEM